MPRLIVLAIAAALAFPAFAQEAAPHMLPFASTGHALELEVAHTATDEEDAAAPTAVTVRLTAAPAWLAVTPAAVTLDALTPGSDALARFAFDVTEDAPVGEPGAMTWRGSPTESTRPVATQWRCGRRAWRAGCTWCASRRRVRRASGRWSTRSSRSCGRDGSSGARVLPFFERMR